MITHSHTKYTQHNPINEKNVGYAIFILDAEGKVENWNQGAEAIFGYSTEEIIGQNFNIFFSVEQNLKSKARGLLDEVIQYGKSSNKGWLKRKDGSEFVSSLLINAICNDNKEPIGFLATVKNLKAEKQIKNAVQKLNGKDSKEHQIDSGKVNDVHLNELTALKRDSEMVSYSLSHDLRAPLRSIDGYIKIIQEDCSTSLNDEAKQLLDLVQRNAGKLSGLIDGLLTFSRAISRDVKKSNVDMNDIAGSVLIELNKSLQFKTKVVMSNLHHAVADYSLMNIVFFNLLSNALKFSNKVNDPNVEISSSKEEGMIIYQIKDNGVGFEMKHAPKLFESFSRLHSSEEYEGAGMGLATVKRIVNKHGGEVWVEAAPGKGATFYFSLPI